MTDLMLSVLGTAGGFLLLFLFVYGFYSLLSWMFSKKY